VLNGSPARAARARLLVASFHPAFVPPSSGGEQRLYYLYAYLSRHFDVTILAPTYADQAEETIDHAPGFRELRVPKAHDLMRLHAMLDEEQIGPECSGLVVALGGAFSSSYAERFAALAEHADIIIHESPFTLPSDLGLGRDDKRRVYNAYNVESHLAAQMLEGRYAARAIRFVADLERSLLAHADLVFAISNEERRLFCRDYGTLENKIVVVPNGFEPAGDAIERAVSVPSRASRSALFMGSAHPPNVEAVRYIAGVLAPRLPDVRFTIIGSVCNKLDTVPQNVAKLGFVDAATKKTLLASCSVALNPMFAGGGTNLKMLDYMAAGAPIVSTLVGARGLDLRDGDEAIIAQGGAFTESLRSVLDDSALARRLGASARSKAYGQYRWEAIADHARDALAALLVAPRPSVSLRSRPRPRLLVLNDFPVMSAKGGGEVRIRELLTELAREFEVELLCLTDELTLRVSRAGPHLVQTAIPKTEEHKREQQRCDAVHKVSISDLVTAEWVSHNTPFMRTFHRLLSSVDAVIFEHPFLVRLSEEIPTSIPVVYSSLNVESDLKRDTLRDRPDAADAIQRVCALENAMLERADLVVCVSENDRDRFLELHREHRYVVVENGVRCNGHTAAAVSTARFPLVVFLGSAHAPNLAAARFILKTLAPKVPEACFAIIGPVCDAIRSEPRPPNAILLGTLEVEEKNAVLRSATVAISPLFAGGGSSLKVPDYFAAGVPVISTLIGVRGHLVEDGRHFVQASAATFTTKLRALLRDGHRRARLAANGLRVVHDKLDWELLGERYRAAMRTLLRSDAVTRD